MRVSSARIKSASDVYTRQILTPELQCDDFHATAGFSNSYGNQYRWDFQSLDGNVEGVWQNHYAHIARCNYFIDGDNKVLDGTVTDLSDANKELIAAYACLLYTSRYNSMFHGNPNYSFHILFHDKIHLPVIH